MTNKRRVYIFWPETTLYGKMFEAEGWEIVKDIYDANLLLLTGGEDVDPALYHHHQHPTTYINQKRDAEEEKVYDLAKEIGLPMAGICRGGQFLNVMNNGTMWQDVDNHNTGEHHATINGINKTIIVSSVHHQMMIPCKTGNVLTLMEAQESTWKALMQTSVIETTRYTKYNTPSDVEALYYPDTNCLCFQPHPEYAGHKQTKEVFFWFLENYCFSKEAPKSIITDHIPF